MVKLSKIKSFAPYISNEQLNAHYVHHENYYKRLGTLIPKDMPSLNDLLNATGAIGNCARQIWIHNFFWDSLDLNGDFEYIKWLNNTHDFTNKFLQCDLFGSGWCWLLLNTYTNELSISCTTNDELPSFPYKPLCVVDLWEHAYYLDYKYARQEWLRIFCSQLVNTTFIKNNLAI